MPTLRILNWQNLQPQRYHTEFSVQKLSAMYNNGFQVTSENTLCEFPLVIATVAKVSRKRGLWLVVRVKNFPAGQTGFIIPLVWQGAYQRVSASVRITFYTSFLDPIIPIFFR